MTRYLSKVTGDKEINILIQIVENFVFFVVNNAFTLIFHSLEKQNSRAI
jgi:hypothetical protein